MPNEVLLRIISFLSCPSCDSCVSTNTPPFHVHSLLLTSKHLHRLALPFLFQRLCLVTAKDVADRERVIGGLTKQLRRPDLVVLVQSLCLHVYSCQTTAQYLDHILRPELEIRSLCVTRHVSVHAPRRRREFNFTSLLENYMKTLQELRVHTCWDGQSNEDYCDSHCVDHFCRNTNLSECFASAQFERLHQLSMDGSSFFQFASRPWDFMPASYRLFWLPSSLEVLDLHYERLCQYYRRSSTRFMSIDHHLEDEMHTFCKKILSPCHQSQMLRLHTLVLSFNVVAPDLDVHTKAFELDPVLRPGIWLNALDTEMLGMGVTVFTKVANQPGLPRSSMLLRDMENRISELGLALS